MIGKKLRRIFLHFKRLLHIQVLSSYAQKHQWPQWHRPDSVDTDQNKELQYRWQHRSGKGSKSKNLKG